VQNLSCTRHERFYRTLFPLSPNYQPPGTARHIRFDSCMPCGAVGCRMHRTDKRRNTRGKIKFDFFRHTRGKRHEP
jgi:hypothetical protein